MNQNETKISEEKIKQKESIYKTNTCKYNFQ